MKSLLLALLLFTVAAHAQHKPTDSLTYYRQQLFLYSDSLVYIDSMRQLRCCDSPGYYLDESRRYIQQCERWLILNGKSVLDYPDKPLSKAEIDKINGFYNSIKTKE